MPDPRAPGTAVIANELYPPTPSDFSSNERNCSRCKVSFKVKSDETHVVKEKCYSHKGLGVYCSRCKNLRTSRGCISAEAHVVDGHGHPDYFRGFVSTTRKTTVPGVSPEVFALDCEMVCCFFHSNLVLTYFFFILNQCHTTIGLAVTKISVIDCKLRVVYETLVKPTHPVIDYNTDFSGLKEEHFVGVTTTIEDVRAKLLQLFSSDTILVGHALRHDLKALKLLHLNVIDTEQVFPHVRGFPLTNALSFLIERKLGIYEGASVKSDKCRRDATACMNLILRKEFLGLY